jgi:hypothetical protein
MSYKLDMIITQLDEILMRLDRIEKLVDFSDEFAPEDVNEAFDKVFGVKPEKPNLTVVTDEPANSNIIEFERDK